MARIQAVAWSIRAGRCNNAALANGLVEAGYICRDQRRQVVRILNIPAINPDFQLPTVP